MMLRGNERFVEVEGTLEKRTSRGILLETELGRGWIGRSCLGYATDVAVDTMRIGEKGRFRVMKWVAEKNGLI